MKTKEVKFKTRNELYLWMTTGKPIYLASRRYKQYSDGVYRCDEDDLILSICDDVSLYSGIEEVPVKKAYAYTYREKSGRIQWHTSDNLAHYGGKLLSRLPQYDLEAKE